MGMCRGAAWGCVGAQRGAAQVRSSVGLRRGAAASHCAGAQQRGAAQGRSSVGLRRGAAARAVKRRSSVGLCRGVAAWAQQPGAAQGRSSVGLRRGAAARGCAGVQPGAALGLYAAQR